MAGGMSRRGADRVPLHERTRGTPPQDPSAQKTDPDEPPPIRHCWVTDDHGRLPGLLLEWRRTVAGWQGRVVRPVLDDGCWVVVEEWLSSTLLSRE